jgi:hypothetical protein
MMTDCTRLHVGEKAPHRIRAVIKILKDSGNKFEYHSKGST